MLSRKSLNMVYAKYACLILYDVIPYLDGYATRFSDEMLCNHGILYAICRCRIRLLWPVWAMQSRMKVMKLKY